MIETGAAGEVAAPPDVHRPAQRLPVLEVQSPRPKRAAGGGVPVFKGEFCAAVDPFLHPVAILTIHPKSISFADRRTNRGIPVFAGRPVVAQIAHRKTISAVIAQTWCKDSGPPALLERKHIEREPEQWHRPDAKCDGSGDRLVILEHLEGAAEEVVVHVVAIASGHGNRSGVEFFLTIHQNLFPSEILALMNCSSPFHASSASFQIIMNPGTAEILPAPREPGYANRQGTRRIRKRFGLQLPFFAKEMDATRLEFYISIPNHHIPSKDDLTFLEVFLDGVGLIFINI